MTLDELRALIEDGRFHHATYRNVGTVWEGLHIYVRDTNGFRGFSHLGAFLKGDPALPAAEALVQGTGVSLGAYSEG